MKTMLKEKKIVIPFVLILLMKIMLAGLFSSDYQNKMFEPFILVKINVVILLDSVKFRVYI